jgi:hypothetical protein
MTPNPQLQDRVSDAVLSTLGDFGAVAGIVSPERSVYRVEGLRVIVESDAASGDLTRDDVGTLVEVCDAYRELARILSRLPGARPWSAVLDQSIVNVREKLRARL